MLGQRDSSASRSQLGLPILSGPAGTASAHACRQLLQ
jgi:hypothetical protein